MKPFDPDTFADLIVNTIGQAMRPLVERIAALEIANARIVALETANAVLEARVRELETTSLKAFAGVYSESKTYEPGDAATRAGGLWICTAPTAGAWDFSCWRLAVKRGSVQ